MVNPLFEAPDESWHYGYVHWLAGGNGLAHPDDRGAAGEQQWAQEGSQPPLYYLAAGLLTAPVTGNLPPGAWDESVRYNPHAAVGNADSMGNRNYLLHGPWDAWPWRTLPLGAHLARLFSVVLGAVTVLFAYLSARLLAPHRRTVAPLAAALVAFTPQFLFISASVSNDNMVTALCAVGVWLGVAVAIGRVSLTVRTAGLLGLLMGLAALSKLSGLLLWPFAALCLVLAARRQRSWSGLLGYWLVAIAAAGLVSGWWYWRNWQLYGDPLGLSAMFAVGPARDEAAGLAELLALGPGVWRSAWAVFGWFNVTAPDSVYWLYTALTALAVLGWAAVVAGATKRLRSAGSQASPENQVSAGNLVSPSNGVSFVAACLFALWIVAVSVALVRWAQINYPQGRLLFPAIAPAMALAAVGLLAWWPLAWGRFAAFAIGAAMAGLAAAAPFLWIAPVYAPPPLLSPAVRPTVLAQEPALHFGDHITLVGYDFPLGTAQQGAPQPGVQAGEMVDVTLYWRTDAPLPADYSVFVHLVDELGIVQAQSDSHPALGGRPTSGWQPGDVVVDKHRLRLPTGLAPGRMTVAVGLYEHASDGRLPASYRYGAAAPIDLADGVVNLSSFALAPRRSAGGIPNPTEVNFDGKIALLGYDLHRRSLKPEDSLPVTLWWRGLAPMERDYVGFVHLVLPPDAVWAQLDRMPYAAPYNQLTPTSTWQPGEVISDTYNLDIAPGTPPGIYNVTIGWYDKDTFARLPVNFDDSDVLIGRVRIQPP